jgi:hypothetical protein
MMQNESNAPELTSDDGVDTGTYLEVPEDQQLDADDPAHEDPNLDEMVTDFSDVPEGEYVTLDTAGLDDDEEDN